MTGICPADRVDGYAGNASDVTSVPQWGNMVVPEVDVILGQIVPAIGAAVGAYGTGVLTRAEDAAADATVSLGRRILAKILHHTPRRAPLETAVTDLAADGQDPDAVAALRLQLRKILTQNPQLIAELAEMLPPARQASATGDRSVAIAGDSSAPISTGDHSPILGLR